MKQQYKQVIDFYNQTTNEQHVYFLQLIANKLTMCQDKETYIKQYKVKEPHNDINLNGIYIDVHLTKDPYSKL